MPISQGILKKSLQILDARYVTLSFSFYCIQFGYSQFVCVLKCYIQFEYVHIVHFGSHRMSVNTISDDRNVPIYINGTSKTDYKDAIYVVIKGNCVTIEELKSISDNESEASS
jgi:hypothetical protein